MINYLMITIFHKLPVSIYLICILLNCTQIYLVRNNNFGTFKVIYTNCYTLFIKTNVWVLIFGSYFISHGTNDIKLFRYWPFCFLVLKEKNFPHLRISSEIHSKCVYRMCENVVFMFTINYEKIYDSWINRTQWNI